MLIIKKTIHRFQKLMRIYVKVLYWEIKEVWPTGIFFYFNYPLLQFISFPSTPSLWFYDKWFCMQKKFSAQLQNSVCKLRLRPHICGFKNQLDLGMVLGAEWSPILSVILQLITDLENSTVESVLWSKEYDYMKSCYQLVMTITILKKNKYIQGKCLQ